MPQNSAQINRLDMLPCFAPLPPSTHTIKHTHLLHSHTARASDVALSSWSDQPGCRAASVHRRLYLHMCTHMTMVTKHT